MTHDELRRLILQQGEELYRDMPWRNDTRGYYVLVSELMLQQTQVTRVIPKFEAFIAAFPDEHTLASASLADVLKLWQGLGYNRRAKYLHEAAKVLAGMNAFPSDEVSLRKLPGVGPNTAGAIMAYTWNQPSVFIETNVRTVLLHHLFDGRQQVADAELRDALSHVIDCENPRTFYWALMDYGAFLKTSGVRNISASAGYKKQTPLKGSVREVRGRIIAVLGELGELSVAQLQQRVPHDERFSVALDGLLKDKLVQSTNGVLHLTK